MINDSSVSLKVRKLMVDDLVLKMPRTHTKRKWSLRRWTIVNISQNLRSVLYNKLNKVEVSPRRYVTSFFANLEKVWQYNLWKQIQHSCGKIFPSRSTFSYLIYWNDLLLRVIFWKVSVSFYLKRMEQPSTKPYFLVWWSCRVMKSFGKRKVLIIRKKKSVVHLFPCEAFCQFTNWWHSSTWARNYANTFGRKYFFILMNQDFIFYWFDNQQLFQTFKECFSFSMNQKIP